MNSCVETVKGYFPLLSYNDTLLDMRRSSTNKSYCLLPISFANLTELIYNRLFSLIPVLYILNFLLDEGYEILSPVFFKREVSTKFNLGFDSFIILETFI